jgi:hypothetical protein
MEQLHDVSAVEVVRDFRLRLTFRDGIVGEIDFTGRSRGGVLEPNGIDLAPEPLYEEARRNRVEREPTTR